MESSYIICPICNNCYRVLKEKHIENHGLTLKDFNLKYPNFIKSCQEVLDKKKIYDSNYRKKNYEYIKQKDREYKIQNRKLLNLKQQKYAEKNINKIKAYNKIYTKKIKEVKKGYDKVYREKNKEHLKTLSKNYRTSSHGRSMKQKWNREDYKKQTYKYAWRRLLYFHLRMTGETKSKRTYELLGYSYIQLKQRIETQFLPGMSWENYGEWHIDHKKPLSSFSKTTPAHITNALCNLQPLWKTTRIINGITYIGNLNKNSKFK